MGSGALIDDNQPLPFPAGKLANIAADDWASKRPQRNHGTRLYFEPLILADLKTIELSVHFEHHNSKPEKSTIGPTLFPKRIRTQVWLENGGYLIIGSWSAGKGENADRWYLVFLTANLQGQPN